ncbi:hypothetical protein CMI46_01720 [Candidatus Pacearchaeota archaeon]|nr:hypothetical protein [Candidatus Pacearchaeota archaeon]|tara:strand:+ start:5930 stop:6565 length:636 start_codon:yes stop_codon:yes gene_type:complete
MKKKKTKKSVKKSVRKKAGKRGLGQEYKDAFKFIGESWNYILFVVALFILISVSVFFGVQNEQLNESFNEQLKQLILEFEGLGSLETIFKIFVNNVMASFLGIFLGVFFGLITLSFIFVNGYLIGYVMDLSVAANGLGVLWRLVPHGIFELPAVLLSFALGVKLGMFFLAKDPWEELKRRARESLNVFILIVVPLLVIAAIIEGILIVAVG